MSGELKLKPCPGGVNVPSSEPVTGSAIPAIIGIDGRGGAIKMNSAAVAEHPCKGLVLRNSRGTDS